MITVKVDMSGVQSKLSKIASDKKLGLVLAQEAADGMRKFVPRRTGALMTSAKLSPFKVTYNTPYARRMFYGQGLRFSKDKHPLARARWDKAFIETGGAEKLGKAATNYLKGR